MTCPASGDGWRWSPARTPAWGSRPPGSWPRAARRWRVVTVSSQAHRIRARINFGDLQGERSYRRVAAYSQSKLANLMFTYELARRLSGAATTIAVAAHPGLAATELTRNSSAASAAL